MQWTEIDGDGAAGPRRGWRRRRCAVRLSRARRGAASDGHDGFAVRGRPAAHCSRACRSPGRCTYVALGAAAPRGGRWARGRVRGAAETAGMRWMVGGVRTQRGAPGRGGISGALVAGQHKHDGDCWAAAPHNSPWSCGHARGTAGSAEVRLAIGCVCTWRGAPGRGGILRGVADTSCTSERCDGGPQQYDRIACACCACPCCAYSVLCVPLLCIPVLRAFVLRVWCACAAFV